MKTKTKTTGSHSLNIHTPQLTGELCFQFDGDEPFRMCDIHDNGEINIKLTQAKEEEKESSIDFEKDGKRFRLFIRKV